MKKPKSIFETMMRCRGRSAPLANGLQNTFRPNLKTNSRGRRILQVVVMMLVILSSKAQTWDFNSNPALGGWGVSNPAPQDYTTNYNPTTWIDMTGSAWGNGKWMSKNVTTVPGKVYRIELDLGTFFVPTWTQFDAGVNIYVTGNALNVGTNRLHHSNMSTNAALPILWQLGMHSNTFVATGCSTTFTIEGNAERINPNDPVGLGAGVIAVDNVKFVEVGDAYNAYDISVSLGLGCNEYCFNIPTPLSLPAPSTITWYVDNVYAATGATYCRRFPKGTTRVVKAVVTINPGCGPAIIRTFTKNITATQDCPCDLQSHTSLTAVRVSCSAYHMNLQFDPDYSSTCSKWSVDGQYVSDLSSVDLTYSPGPHNICVSLLGGMTGDGDNICCAKLCTTINVPVATVENRVIPYCPITYPYGPWYYPCNDCTNDYFEFYKNNILQATSANGCATSYLLDAPAELRCYDIVNGVHCLKKTIYLTTQALPINGIQSPDETVTICGDANSTYAYNVSCGLGYPNYELYGPNSFYTQGSVTPFTTINLSVGTYTLDCVNYSTCSMNRRIIHVVQQQMSVSQCGVLVEECYQLSEENQFSYLNLMNCPECQNVIRSATSSGPWVHLSYGTTGFNGYRVVQKEYIDMANCRKCVVTVTVANARNDHAEYTFNTHGQPCMTITSDLLIDCLQNSQLKAFPLGSPSNTIDIAPGASFQLCCNADNGLSGAYYLYSVDDPCCYMIIHLDCAEGEVPPGAGGRAPQSTTPAGPGLLDQDYRLVPNPTSSYFRIESTRGEVVYESVEIRDLTGATVISKQNVDSKTYIDLGKFAKGTYFVTVITKTGSATLKLVTMDE
jgi:hypothetical protein